MALPYLSVLIAAKVLQGKGQNLRHVVGEAAACINSVYVQRSRSSEDTLKYHVTNVPGQLPSVQQDQQIIFKKNIFLI